MAGKSSVIKVSIIGVADSVKKAFAETSDAAEDMEKKSSGAFGKFSESAGGLGKIAGLGLAGGIAGAAALGIKGFSDAMDAEKGNDKLAAQLGLSPEKAAEVGKVAGKLYAGAWGDSLGDVNETIRQVTTNIGEGNADWLKKTSALSMDFGSTFGQDMERVTAAVGTMLNTGVAESSEEAFDILTRGMQTGANKADDLLDTFIEYPTMFRELGLDGEKAMGLLSQGLQGGARDADTVADALKEFGIRGQDASAASAAGFAALGLNAQEMTAKIAGGGEGASAALDQVLDGLRGMTDPVARNAAAVALFGTKAEDLGDALFALDPSEAAAGLGEVGGAAQKMSDDLNDNVATKIEGFKRTVFQGIANFVATYAIPAFESLVGIVQEHVVPALRDAGEWAQTHLLPALQTMGSFIADTLVPGLQTLGKFVVENKDYFMAAAVGIGVALVPALILWAVSAGAAAVATIAAAAPVILITGAIALLAAGILYAYNHFGAFRTAIDAIGSAFQWVFGWVRDNWQLVLGILTGPIGLAVAVISGHWDTIKGFFTGAVGFITGALTGLADAVTAPFRTAFNGIARLWNNTVGALSFSIPSWVPGGIGGKGWSVPDIPMMAAGGIVTGPTLAMIGEGVNDEAVVPLPRGWKNGDGGLGGGVTNHITIVAPVGANPRDIGRELRKYLNEYDRAAGVR